MVKRIQQLAKEFNGKNSVFAANLSANLDSEIVSELDSEIVSEAARRSKSKTMTSKQMRKSWQKYKEEYHSCKNDLASLERQQEALDAKVEDMRKKLFESRKGMLDMSKALDKLDLSGASHSVFYDSGDVAFIIDKEEYHMDIKDGGEYDLMSMKEFLKNKKREDEPEDEPEEDLQGAVDENFADDNFYENWLQEFSSLDNGY